MLLLILGSIMGASALFNDCLLGPKNPILPSEASLVLRAQINASLAMHNIPIKLANMEKAFAASDWDKFAIVAGTKDFSITTILDTNVEDGSYIHFSYALGGNNFGSVHLEGHVQPVITVWDGNWAILRGAKIQSELICLQDAEFAGNCVSEERNKATPIPSDASSMLKAQINESLVKNVFWYDPEVTKDITKAFTATSWESFAQFVGTQDFYVIPLVDNDDKTTFVRLSYAMGDNDVGSVFLSNQVEEVANIQDGDWSLVGSTITEKTMNCLDSSAYFN